MESRETDSVEWQGIAERIREKAQNARERRIVAEEGLAEALTDGANDEICGPYPEQCFGAFDMGSVPDVRCPLDLTGECPYATERERYRRECYLGVLGFGERARDPRIEAVHADARYAVELYCDNIAERLARGAGMIITGPVGVGKTCIEALVAWAAGGSAVPRPGVVYTSSRKLFMSLASDQTELAGLAGRAKRTQLLLIDDFGTEGLSGWKKSAAVAAFHDLIDTRWHKGRATVLASNRALQELKGEAGVARAVDRLAEYAALVEVPGAAPSQRERQPVAVQDEMPFDE